MDGGWSFPSVLLPLVPVDGRYNARVLFWGGATPKWIDTDAANPAWTPAGARAAGQAGRQRINGNAVLLPTGQVCQVGGVNVVGNPDPVVPDDLTRGTPEDPMRQAEIYTPDINWITGAYGNGGGSWTTDAVSSASVRNYHSTALLLPNGKVWTAGGNINAQSGDPNTVGVKLIELYEPAYIAVANRVQIQSSPALLA